MNWAYRQVFKVALTSVALESENLPLPVRSIPLPAKGREVKENSDPHRQFCFATSSRLWSRQSAGRRTTNDSAPDELESVHECRRQIRH